MSANIDPLRLQRCQTKRERAVAVLVENNFWERVGIHVTAAIVGWSLGVVTYRSIPADMALTISMSIGLAAFVGSVAIQENRILQRQMDAVIALLTDIDPPPAPHRDIDNLPQTMEKQ